MGGLINIDTEMEQITTIAWQCPLKSAAAVYKARSMYALVHPFTRFDNYSICNAQGMQYRAAQQTGVTKPAVSMQIYPNPNSGQLNIGWSVKIANGKPQLTSHNQKPMKN